MEQRIQELEQQLSILKRQYEIDKEEAAKKAKEATVVTASLKDGFSLKSADDSYKLKISGYAQTDARLFLDKDKESGNKDSFLMRTVRPVFSGSLADLAEFYISPELAGSSLSLPDAYVDLKILPGLKLRGGKFKAPFALERTQSITALTFGELGLPGNLAPNRDMGFQVFGDLFKETLFYAVGIFNGLQDGASSVTDSNNDKDFGARLFFQPFKNADTLSLRGFGFGIAVTYGDREDAYTSLPAYKTTGQTSFFSYASGVSGNGTQMRWSPQLYYYNKSFGLLAEYIVSKVELQKSGSADIIREAFENSGGQVALSYVLTGEDATYKSVTPLHPFSLKEHQWGAFELAARYATLGMDENLFSSAFAMLASSASEAEAYTLGINWHLTRNVKFVLDYEKTLFEGGSANGADRADEDLLLTRIQLQY